MTQLLDDDQLRAARLFEGSPKEGILEWFRETEIGRTTLKTLGRKLAKRDGRPADEA